MIDSIAFRTRARTIDHLGREQIADCPTAVSELWKNAYDAYALSVALHIFNGEIPVAAILDDGHGMNRKEFEKNWLVIGTESKKRNIEVSPADMQGLPFRPKQGQKGIGRLSSANLGSLLLLVSKRESDSFVASLVDWRLFENPYLYLEDVQIPIVEFETKIDLWTNLPNLFEKLMGNVWGNGTNDERDERIIAAWSSFDALEDAEGHPSTRDAIEQTLVNATFSERHIEQWPVWAGRKSSGTALLIAQISYDLEAQLQSSGAKTEEDTVLQAQDKLRQTLIGFTDLYADAESKSEASSLNTFRYSVTAWNGALPKQVIAEDRVFGLEDLLNLEHIIEGFVDINGVFTGRVKAFGQWLPGEATILPSVPVSTRANVTVGEFHFRMGSYERTATNSTFPQEIYDRFDKLKETYGGLMVYRDGLRVLPYGRTNSDYFEIDQRRNQNAGREFWATRNMFGRIALTRDKNPNLRDKAGREGLIDNKAAKVFRDLFENILRVSARRFFGSASEVRGQRLPEIQEMHKRREAEEAKKQVGARKRKEFRNNLQTFLPKIEAIEAKLLELARIAENDALPKDETSLISLHQQVAELKTQKSEMGLGSAPKTLGALETEYKKFRTTNSSANELISRISASLSIALEAAKPVSARDAAYSELNRNAAQLHARLRKWSVVAKDILNSEIKRVTDLVEDRNKAYHVKTLPLLDDLELGRAKLPKVLDQLASIREDLDAENSAVFEPYISTLRSLQEQVDIENLVNFTLGESAELRGELDRLNSLAQLGIAVEIIGHELEGLEGEVTRGLNSLPTIIKTSPVFQTIQTAHRTLVEKLRFLAPLKLSGERNKSWISGQNIFDYINAFLGDSLQDRAITLEASPSFLQFSVYEQATRIYPVFINLVNNSAYWVEQILDGSREIFLGATKGRVIVSDSGPGIEDEDQKHLFTLFFTRKIRGGRGVGLYLCRASLAAGSHTIEYVTDENYKHLKGANFLIDFKGAKYE
jgi:signal transduction histidine kinase